MVVLPILVVCGLFAAVLLAIEAGHRVGIRRRPQGPRPVYPAVESSVFALMGLLIAFTFEVLVETLKQMK
jgi:hypothetical protein